MLLPLVALATADIGPPPTCEAGKHHQYLYRHRCVRDGYRLEADANGRVVEVSEDAPPGRAAALPTGHPEVEVPLEAREARVSGTVKVVVQVESDGSVIRVRRMSGAPLGHGLDEACVAAWGRVPFSAARRDGQAVPSASQQACRFEDGVFVTGRPTASSAPPSPTSPPPLPSAPAEPAPSTTEKAGCVVASWPARLALAAAALAAVWRRRRPRAMAGAPTGAGLQRRVPPA